MRNERRTWDWDGIACKDAFYQFKGSNNIFLLNMLWVSSNEEYVFLWRKCSLQLLGSEILTHHSIGYLNKHRLVRDERTKKEKRSSFCSMGIFISKQNNNTKKFHLLACLYLRLRLDETETNRVNIELQAY